MNQMDFNKQTAATDRVHHGGTFNGNPLVAEAGIAALTLLKDGDFLLKVNALTDKLRKRLQEIWNHYGIPGEIYGESSVFHVSFEPESRHGTPNPKLLLPYDALKKSLANHGVLMRRFTGMLSTAHTDEDIDTIVSAFDKSIQIILKQGYVRLQ